MCQALSIEDCLMLTGSLCFRCGHREMEDSASQTLLCMKILEDLVKMQIPIREAWVELEIL